VCSGWASDEHDVPDPVQAVVFVPRGLAQPALDLVADDGSTDLAAHREPDPTLAALSGEEEDDDVVCVGTTAAPLDPSEVGASLEAP